jgi:hypothetical protein
VLADGKLYVGTENGKFFILKPSATGCEILDQDQLGTETDIEAILGSVAVAHGRVYLVSDKALYCIGKKAKEETRERMGFGDPISKSMQSAATYVQVVPTELMLKPGESVRLRARLFDEKGHFLGEEPAAWSLDKLKGSVSESGQFTAATEMVAQAGTVKATVGNLTGAARVRVIPPLPWNETFDAYAVNTVPGHWVNTALKYVVREVDGQKVLVKTTEGSSLLSRARAFFGPTNLANYTVEADIRATEKRRQMGDAGVIAQRYALVLYGNSQKLHLEPWQPETARTVDVPFAWKADTWYRVKLQVETLPDGKVRARGKAWLAAETEPAAWMIERVDPIPNLQGSPGIFGSAPAEIFFDNLKVTANK